MREIKKICLCGLGAIGSGYASRIYDLDPESIDIIVDEDRKKVYSENGIHINDKKYDFNFLTPNEATYKADLVLIATKQHHLIKAIKQVENFVGPNTIILSLLNGIISEKYVIEAFGHEKVLYSFCVGTDMVREGTNTTFSHIGKIVFGEAQNSTMSENVQAVKDFFEKVNIPHTVPEDMLRELWWKFMMNVGLNQVSAVLRAPYGTFAKVPEARELLFSASMEVVNLAAKEGVSLTQQDIQKYIDIVAKIDPKGKTSMYQDVDAQRKTEVEIFAGTVMELGIKHSVPTPVNDMLYKMIRIIEQSY